MFIQHIGATGLQNITDGDESYISCVEFTVYGLTGSMVPQCVQMTDGPTAGLLAAVPNYFNCGYVNANTGVSYTAGTAITADGRYIIDTTGAKFALNVTDAGDGDFYVYGKPLAGPAPSFAASGGGGAVTIADGADVALGTTTDTAVGDATGTLISHARMSAKAAAQGAADNSTNSTFKAPVLSGTANAAAPSWTEARQVPLSTDLAGNLRVITTAGAGAADNSTNSTSKAPVLVGTANAAAPSWTEGRQVPASVDLSGNLRTILAAAANVIGKVGGITRVAQPTVTVTASAYAAGNNWGGKVTMTNALGTTTPATGAWSSLNLTFKGTTPPLLDVILFGANPAGTFTDKSAFPTMTAADNLLVVARISVISTDWVTVGGSSYATIKVGGLSVSATTSGTLYTAMNVTSGTPTPAATTDFTAGFGFFTDQ